MSRIAFLFPGQGSQYVGMGEDLLNSYEFAPRLFEEAEAATGLDIKELCTKGPMDELTRTINLQPCLTTVDILCAMALMDEGVKPDMVAGHSLGEYPALWACDVLDFSSCLKLVKERGQLMEEAALERPGAMAAIIGVEAGALDDLIKKVLDGRDGVLSTANHNSREQIVVTGHRELVDVLCGEVKKLGKKAIMLKVSGGYHSSLMDEAAARFKVLLTGTDFHDPTVPLYSNVSAEPETDRESILNLMIEQMRKPVRWYEIVNNMYRDGVRIFIETGPKKVLSNLVRKSIDAKDVKVFNVEKSEDIKNLKRELSF